MREFEMTRSLRFGNRLVTPLLRMGIPMGRMCLLTVTGRRSGLPRTTPVAITEDGSGWLLIAAYGRVDWVRNLEFAGEAVVERRRRQHRVRSQVMASGDAAEVLRTLYAGVDPMTRRMISPYFKASVEAPVSEWIEEAEAHPVFRLIPIDA